VNTLAIERSDRLSEVFGSLHIEAPDQKMDGWNFKVGTIAEQLRIIHRFIPDCRITIPVDIEEIETRFSQKITPLSSKIDGMFVSAPWHIFGSSYSNAFEKVLSAIVRQRFGRFWISHDYEEEIGEVCIDDRTRDFLDKFDRCSHGSDVRIVPAQIRRVPRSRTPWGMPQRYEANEFGLDPITVALSLLTHKDRLSSSRHPPLICPGGYPKKEPLKNVYFWHGHRDLIVGTRGWGESGDERYISATGYLPENL